MASLALSLGSPTPAPALIASRRVDFHLRKQLVLPVEASAGRLLHRGVRSDSKDPGRRRRAGRPDGDGARRHRRGTRARRPAGQPPRDVLASPSRAGRRQRGGAGPAQGPAPSDRGGTPRGPRDAGRAIHHPGRRRAAGAARAAGPRLPSRKTRAAARVSHRRPRLHQRVRPVRDELGDRRARHLAARCDGLLAGDRGDARRRHPGDRRRRASTASWWNRATTAPWRARSCGC